MKSENEKRLEVERRILSRFVRDALAGGFSVSIWNGGNEPELAPSSSYRAIMGASRAADVDSLVLWKDGVRAGKVLFVYGNGPDVLSDYSDNAVMDGLVAGAVELSGRLS